MILPRRTRGEPIVALALVLCGWLAGRLIAWQGIWQARGEARAAAASGGPHAAVRSAAAAWPAPATAPLPAPLAATPLPPARQPGMPLVAAAAVPGWVAKSAVATVPPRAGAVGGYQPLWHAATALPPLPLLGLRTLKPESDAAVPLATAPRRWSGDAWLLLRGGSAALAPGSLAGTYGASQAGGVLRYRIAPTSTHRLTAYLRAATALNGIREQELSLGLSAWPLARLPVVALAEVRALRDGGGLSVRPAVALVTAVPVQRLRFGFTAELYGQAGYIAGRTPTAFADGLIRAERPVAELGTLQFHAGAGAWGARQRGTGRVDAGPVASLRFNLGDTASARIEADWRFRVAGDARPGSGPALTLSAGF